MDLVECRDGNVRRHFWETAKLHVVRNLLRPYVKEKMTVVDIGCGDCFLPHELHRTFLFSEIQAVDPNLDEQKRRELMEYAPEIHFLNSAEPEDLPECDLYLLCDVLEHIENDALFLEKLYARMPKQSILFLTVPAYGFLFSEHDRFLNHFRRYTRTPLRSRIRGAGYAELDSGYFFMSLIPFRLMQKLAGGKHKHQEGVGKVPGAGLNGLFRNILILDAELTRLIHKTGLELPGLSCYLIAQKQ